MEDISVNDDDDHEEEEEDWDIGLSSTCPKQVQSPSVPISVEEENNNDAEETDEADDDYDDYDEDEEDEDHDDDDGKCDLGCPYCTENFDILGLCCHIDDQHFKEAKSGICPICAKKLETSMTVHIIVQHESFLRALRKEKFRDSRTRTNLSLLKREQVVLSQLKSSRRLDSSYDLSPDLLLLSFLRNSKTVHRPETLQAGSGEVPSGKSSNDVVERNIELPLPLTEEKVLDKAQVCEFVNGLLFSTICKDGP